MSTHDVNEGPTVHLRKAADGDEVVVTVTGALDTAGQLRGRLSSLAAEIPLPGPLPGHGPRLVEDRVRIPVAGGLAAISPGTDILIQGYLGTQMVKALCELHDVPVREIELQKLLNLSQQQVRTALPLLLAVAGNAAKAFPGVGTLAGGLMHAVAYGLIFDALGRAVVRTLETRGELRPAPASLTFRDNLVTDVESQARRLLRLALDIRKEQDDNKNS